MCIKMKKIILLAVLALWPLLAMAQFVPAEKIDLPGATLRNLHRVDEKVYRSEQPAKEDFPLLEELGIREVLNMRRLHSDEGKAEGTSLKLHRMKVNTGRMSLEQMVEALRMIRDAQGPILIHCWHGSDRTGAVIALYRMVFHNVPKEAAVREMTEGGFGFHPVYSPIVLTILNADVEAIRRYLGINITN